MNTILWTALFVLALVLLLFLGRVLFPKDNSNAAELMATYRVMTRELFDNTPNDQLIKAVVANMLAKADASGRDAYAVIPALSQEHCTVYSVWLFQNELKRNDPTVLHQSERFGFSELAADGLDLLGLPELAADLRSYLQTADETLAVSLKHALTAVPLDETMIAFIRDHADIFCDGDTE